MASPSLAHFQDIVVAAAGGIGKTLLLFLFAFRRRSDHDDRDGRLLQAVFGDGARQEPLNATKTATTRSDNEEGRLINSDLLSSANHVSHVHREASIPCAG